MAALRCMTPLIDALDLVANHMQILFWRRALSLGHAAHTQRV